MKATLTKTYINNIDPFTCDARHYDMDLKNFYLQVSKAGTKTFYFRIKLNGMDKPYKIGRFPDITVDKARKLAMIAASDVVSGIDPQAKRINKRKKDKFATLNGYIENTYADYLKTEKKSGEKMLKLLEGHFGQWSDKQLTDINEFLVMGWRKKQLKKGRTAGAVNRPIAYLRALLNHALEYLKLFNFILWQISNN